MHALDQTSSPAQAPTPTRAMAFERWASPIHSPSLDYERHVKESLALLRAVCQDLSPLKQASSLGAEDVVITHMIESLGLHIPVFVLDTGALHHQTLALLERTQARAKLPIEVYKPAHADVLHFVSTKGQASIYRSLEERKACCDFRKLKPLGQALKGQRAWITGLRREQSSARSEVGFCDESELQTQGWTKVNPLVNWTWSDVWHYIEIHQVDYNPLHDELYPSIGCAPCTRAISMGEEFRAGRWWWEDENAKECGLHVRMA
ncbi:MAG: phosphoadenylyl-sulfate reductase [Betaproteobacteria bacterium]